MVSTYNLSNPLFWCRESRCKNQFFDDVKVDRITLQIDLVEQDMSKSEGGIHDQARGEIWYLQSKIVDFHISYRASVYYLKQSLEEALPVFTRIGNKHVVKGYLDIYAPLKANQGIPKWVFVCVREVFAEDVSVT